MPRLKTLAPRLAGMPDRIKQTASADSWRTSGMTSAQRGYGHKWRVARAAYLRAHPFCAYCLRDVGISYDQAPQAIGEQLYLAGLPLPFASVVDHTEAHNGNMTVFWDSSKWAALCTNHHNSEAQARDNAARR